MSYVVQVMCVFVYPYYLLKFVKSRGSVDPKQVHLVFKYYLYIVHMFRGSPSIFCKRFVLSSITKKGEIESANSLLCVLTIDDNTIISSNVCW